MFLSFWGPLLAVTVRCDEWPGTREEARYCLLRSDKEFFTGRADTSCRKWLTEAIRWQPVTPQMAAFWSTWSFAMRERDSLENQTGSPYWITDFMGTFARSRGSFFCCLHVVPARSFKIRSRESALYAVFLACYEKLRQGSKWMPRILGFISGWSKNLLRITSEFCV